MAIVAIVRRLGAVLVLSALVVVASACRDGDDPEDLGTADHGRHDGLATDVGGDGAVADQATVDSSDPDHGEPVGTGEVVITEFLADPDAVGDTAGEWVELYNPGNDPIDLQGWKLRDDDSNSHTIGSSLVIQPKGYAVLARNGVKASNGGVDADYEYSGFTLSNDVDEIELVDGDGTVVDRVAYEDGWFLFAGYSTALKQPSLDNGVRNNWCFSNGAWSGSDGDWGSPGQANVCTPTVPTGCTHQTSGTLNFNSYLCPLLVAGAKEITLRNGHSTVVEVGEWARLYCTGFGIVLEGKVTVARHTTYGGITADEWGDDGFSSQSEMLSIMEQYYPGITLESDATVFRWTDTALCD